EQDVPLQLLVDVPLLQHPLAHHPEPARRQQPHHRRRPPEPRRPSIQRQPHRRPLERRIERRRRRAQSPPDPPPRPAPPPGHPPPAPRRAALAPASRRTPSGEFAPAASPYTVSVGNATSFPAPSAAAASAIASARSCGVASASIRTGSRLALFTGGVSAPP